ncbi:MAG: deoxyribonuclease [Thermosediminibacterales bacterium]|nr:deoxyribonuclease [Thermosediminibacterales bacterium]MDK2835855.1 deoxyribonuclease [Thermosediminibacterales bacterium]
MFLGAHVSVSKGYEYALKQALDINGTTMQFFTRNPRGSKAKALNMEDIKKSSLLAKEKGFGPFVAHAPYTLNLATYKEDLWEFAKDILKDDLERMGTVGVPYLVVHPGSHLGKGEEYAQNRIINALNSVIKGDEKTMVLLETMAGMGSEVGYTFQQLKAIIDGVDYPEKIGVCFDSCHLFAAGYDIKDNLDEVLSEFDKIIGISKLKAFHVNDSIFPIGSRKDRHANIGEGKIGLEALKRILTHTKLRHLPFILETPGGIDTYRKEISLLKDLIKKEESR